MKSVNFDFNLSVNDMINQLVENYKNKEEIVGIYKVCYFEEDDLLTKFKNHVLNMEENDIYPFGTFDMHYDNLIEFNPKKLERKKENHE